MKSLQAIKEQQPKVKIIAAIPTYNEASYIEKTVYGTAKYVDQVIVVDDGSTDKTFQIAEEAGAYVILHENNKGYGGAIKTCLDAIKQLNADIGVILDGDGQHDPKDITSIIQPIIDKQADIVVGSRFLNNHNNVPRYRKLGIDVITWLYNFGSIIKVSDAQSGFRAFNKKALTQLLPLQENNMSISVEILIKARKLGLVIQEVPISCLYLDDSSTLNPVIHGVSVALSTVRQRLMTL